VCQRHTRTILNAAVASGSSSRTGQAERQRADYNRRAGTRYVFGAYNVHADRLRVRLRPNASEH
jgi:hypothetical protein